MLYCSVADCCSLFACCCCPPELHNTIRRTFDRSNHSLSCLASDCCCDAVTGVASAITPHAPVTLRRFTAHVASVMASSSAVAASATAPSSSSSTPQWTLKRQSQARTGNTTQYADIILLDSAFQLTPTVYSLLSLRCVCPLRLLHQVTTAALTSGVGPLTAIAAVSAARLTSTHSSTRQP